jgi:GH43 family beta-xylosidase
VHISDIQIRDPFVFVENGIYYLFGSTDKDIWKGPGVGFDVYKSGGSLAEFDGPYSAFRPPENFWSAKNFWAPEVYEHGGAYYMFATFLPEPVDTPKVCRGTAVLKSNSVMGPFVPWSDGPVTPHDWECLDGTFYQEIDKQGVATPWMIFCHEWQQVGDGQICAVQLSGDLRKTAGEPILLFRASEAPWSAPLKGRAPGSYVTDGPNMYRTKGGTLLILWSSFGEDGGYCIGVARSVSGGILGPWVQEEKALYAADGGHGMLFHAFDGRLYLSIHTPNKTPNERAIFVELIETNISLEIKAK